ncbi:MAG: glycosyltransferase family 39 protein [Planctomycetes bacterium]|nr:glycosyltransferase family 39 protein [Planctomycetota bacterium]
MIAIKFEAGLKSHKEDTVNLIILLFIAFLLGIYLIVTTVLVAPDGIYYIERAQKLSSDPSSVIRSHSPGYPFLVFIALKFVGLFNSNPSAQTWAYTAQSMTLLCRLLAIIPLYFIGKLFVGPRNSFWALLILILLPYPARFGSDVLRDWPHILFLAAGFLFLLWGAEQGKWWFWGIVGLAAGLGFIIRPECAQLVLYSILWLCIKLLKPNCNMSRAKLLYALFILLIGLSLPLAFYTQEGGKKIPIKLRQLIDSSKEYTVSHFQAQSEQEANIDNHNGIYSILSLFSNIIKAIGRLIGEISDNLMYFYLPALLIGFYYRFGKQSKAMAIERFFVPAFIVLNIIMLILLRLSYGYISRRHCLPLVVFSIFYVPIGLQIFAEWLNSRFSKACLENNSKSHVWFFILVAVGVTICLPKLVRPLRIEKKGYRDAAKWLKENTAEEDLIVVPDFRIGFYAERDISTSENENAAEGIDYIVSLVKDENEEPEVGRAVQKKLSLWLDERRKKYKLIIYEVL